MQYLCSQHWDTFYNHLDITVQLEQRPLLYLNWQEIVRVALFLQNTSIRLLSANDKNTEIPNGNKVVEWAIHMSSTLFFKAETAEINGAHSGGLP